MKDKSGIRVAPGYFYKVFRTAWKIRMDGEERILKHSIRASG
jgi:hypothetical protein